ncbi:MAG: hypothetical protein ACH349_01360 [Candidatus Rhabdochlamydia sp.]
MVENDLKICSKCNCAKIADKDFYKCLGKRRSECKACTISKNVLYQKRIKAWKHRFVDNDEQKSYLVDYYAKNKEKFAEYRRKFREKYPEYHKHYSRKRKTKIVLKKGMDNMN